MKHPVFFQAPEWRHRTPFSLRGNSWSHRRKQWWNLRLFFRQHLQDWKRIWRLIHRWWSTIHKYFGLTWCSIHCYLDFNRCSYVSICINVCMYMYTYIHIYIFFFSFFGVALSHCEYNCNKLQYCRVAFHLMN